MSDDNGGFDYCEHIWEPIYDDEGNQIGKRCKSNCGTTIGW